MSGQFRLLRERRFAPLFHTQFLGAFNDNLYKNALVVLLTFQATQWTTLSPGLLANLAAGIFILPFFLFSATAGQLADKFDKARLARLAKLIEVAIMGVALVGFWGHSLMVLLLALFLLGLQATLFGPVKYAILPQHLHPDELVGGNALIEAGTFVAILLGTLLGGLLAGAVAQPAWIAAIGLVVAVAGWLASRGIPSAPPPCPNLTVNLNPLTETWRNIAFARGDRGVFLSILGISWFWLYGALFLAQFPAYTKDVLGGGEATVTLLLAIFTVGIGIGSLLCERLSGKHVEIGLVPFGSMGLTLFGLDLWLASPTDLVGTTPHEVLGLLSVPAVWRVLGDLLLLGLFGGFFIVPLYALVQQRSEPTQRARVIAANNILNALFMVVGALGAAALLQVGWSIPALFGFAALLNLGVALYIYGLVPEFLLRFLAWLFVRGACRLRVTGAEHFPEHGPVVLRGAPMGLHGAMFLLAAASRPIVFVMGRDRYETPVLGRLFRRVGAIPVEVANDGRIAWSESALARLSTALGLGAAVFIGEPPSSQPRRLDAVLAQHAVPIVGITLRGRVPGKWWGTTVDLSLVPKSGA